MGKKGDFGSRTELHRVVDAPRRGPAAGTASRRDRWGKEGTGEYIYYKLLLLFANSSFVSIPIPHNKYTAPICLNLTIFLLPSPLFTSFYIPHFS